MKVVIAPDSFKGSVSAAGAANAIKRGWLRGCPDTETTLLPMADGGEGTLDVLFNVLEGSVVSVDAEDALGNPISAEFGLIAPKVPGGATTAVIETASASGIQNAFPSPSDAAQGSTYGTGQVIAAALDSGADQVILALGGTATTDGGAGMIEALGVRLLDAYGARVGRGGQALQNLAAIDLSHVHPRVSECTFVLACDVDNPLLGQEGAARVYAPQKGADDQIVAELEAGLDQLRHVCAHSQLEPKEESLGAGAAGGLGFGAMTFLGARRSSGFDLVADAVGLDKALMGADLVITGEGRIDTQSQRGKTPAGILRRANAAEVPAVVLAGDVSGSASAVADGAAVFGIIPRPVDLETALDGAEENLTRTAEQVARLWACATSRITFGHV